MGLADFSDAVVRDAADRAYRDRLARYDTRDLPGFLHLVDQALFAARTECAEFGGEEELDDGTYALRNPNLDAIVREASRAAVEITLAALVAAEQASTAAITSSTDPTKRV